MHLKAAILVTILLMLTATAHGTGLMDRVANRLPDIVDQDNGGNLLKRIDFVEAHRNDFDLPASDGVLFILHFIAGDIGCLHQPGRPSLLPLRGHRWKTRTGIPEHLRQELLSPRGPQMGQRASGARENELHGHGLDAGGKIRREGLPVSIELCRAFRCAHESLGRRETPAAACGLFLRSTISCA